MRHVSRDALRDATLRSRRSARWGAGESIDLPDRLHRRARRSVRTDGNTASITTYSSDPNTANDSSSVTVLVDALPIASFTFSRRRPVVGDTVSVRWQRRRTTTHGSPASPGHSATAGPGTGLVTTHAYTIAGTYAATLTVTDAIGGTSTATRTVVVSNVGPNPPPSAGRALRGTVTRIVAFGPGGDPAGGRVPLAGAVVTVGSARQGGIQTTTDAQGRYVFTEPVLRQLRHRGHRAGIDDRHPADERDPRGQPEPDRPRPRGRHRRGTSCT